MSRVICWFKGHDYVRVKPLYPMVVPSVGVLIKYEEDPYGSSVACSRCRRVKPTTEEDA